jgi:signal transduction histidine kinase
MTGFDIKDFDKHIREIKRGNFMHKNRDFLLRTLLGKYFEEEKREISIQAIEKLMTTISYYLGDPLTVIQGKAEILEGSLRSKDLPEEEIEDFLSLCKEQLARINMVLNALRSLSELRYRSYPLGVEMIDIEDKIKHGLERNRLTKMELCRKERG